MDRILLRAIDEDIIDGGVLVVVRDGVVQYQLAAGERDAWAIPTPMITADTIFDVASLAKPIATVTAAAYAVREGRIDAQAPAEDGWSLDDLLMHRAGFPEYVAWRDVEEHLAGASPREALLRAIGDPRNDGASHYSNIGYLLASSIIEDAVTERLGDYTASRAWGKLGMLDTAFRLSEEQRERVALAAEDLAPGQAFDPLADYWIQRINRDPGHSGLFSTALDLTIWSSAMMVALNDEGDELHDIARFVIGDTLELRDETGRRVHRTRGFLLREDDVVFGPILEHTGFTGCALWLDPRRQIAVVLLTCGADGESPRWRRTGDEILRRVRTGARHGG